MHCPNCGSKVLENAKFCVGCGTVLESQQKRTYQGPPMPQEMLDPPMSNATIVLGIGLCVLGFVSVFMIFAYGFSQINF